MISIYEVCIRGLSFKDYIDLFSGCTFFLTIIMFPSNRYIAVFSVDSEYFIDKYIMKYSAVLHVASNKTQSF
jgi:hypothetical protein